VYKVFGREAEIESEPKEKHDREPFEVEVSGVGGRKEPGYTGT
jgi:hypothetical protein